MSKVALLAKNALLIAISRISTQLVVFLMLPLYTSILSPKEYGAVDLIITYGSLFAPLIMLNVQQSVFRYLIDARSDSKSQHKIITNSLEIALITSSLAAAVYFIASMFVSIPFASIMSFYFASFIIADLVLQIARGLGHTKAFAFAGIAQGILTIVLNLIFMIPLRMGAEGMLLGMTFGTLIPAIFLAVVIGIHRSIRVSARDLSTKKKLLAFSLPLIPNSISWWVFSASDRTIISIVMGIAANGIYAVTNKFSNIANSFSAIFYASWSESAALAINEPDRDEFFSSVANMTLRSFTTLGVLIMCTTPLVFPILVGERFREALLYLPILILGTIFNTIVSFYSAIYIAKKLTRQVTNTSIIAAVINLIVNISLIWSIGIWAAAISTATAYGIMAIYRHYDMMRYVKITYERGIFIKLGALFFTITGLYYVSTIWASLLSIIISVIAAYLLNRNEIKQIKNMLLRGKQL